MKFECVTLRVPKADKATTGDESGVKRVQKKRREDRWRAVCCGISCAAYCRQRSSCVAGGLTFSPAANCRGSRTGRG